MAMTPSVLKCPDVGHKTFENSLKNITVGNADTQHQTSKIVRAHSCVLDDLNIQYAPGELQKLDLNDALATFHGRAHFLSATFNRHHQLFQHSPCCIYQFQTVTSTQVPFVFGLFITDGNHNLLDFCVDTQQAHKRRPVLLRLMRAVCTPASIARRLDH
jgi:hypothetical protein